MPATNNRYYAMDTLRMVMMFLGIVVHASMLFVVEPMGIVWPVKDPHHTSILLDILTFIIHCFRMNVFMIMSGFLTAMLYFEKGPEKMLTNRIKRLLFPLIICLVIMYPVVTILMDDTRLIISGTATPPFATAFNHFFTQFKWQSDQLFHLWFLYYLVLYCFLAYAIAMLAKKYFPKTDRKFIYNFGVVLQHKWAPLVFAPVTWLCLLSSKSFYIQTPYTLKIDLDIFIIYAVCFAFGWVLYHHKHQLKRFSEDYKSNIIVSLCLIAVQVALGELLPASRTNSLAYLLAAMNAVTVWLFSFGIIGLFVKHFNRYSPISRYFADASYWVYIVHFPLCIYFGSLLIAADINALLKFALVLSATAITGLVTYHYLVRNTFIGVFLNGRKYAGGLPVNKPGATEEPKQLIVELNNP